MATKNESTASAESAAPVQEETAKRFDAIVDSIFEETKFKNNEFKTPYKRMILLVTGPSGAQHKVYADRNLIRTNSPDGSPMKVYDEESKREITVAQTMPIIGQAVQAVVSKTADRDDPTKDRVFIGCSMAIDTASQETLLTEFFGA